MCLSVYHIHSHQVEGPATNKNEYYSFRQLDDPVYDDASSTQPNYSHSSLSPDNEVVNYSATNGYDSTECSTKPKTQLAKHIPKNESHTFDAEQHPCDVTNDARKKKKSDAEKCPKEVIKVNKKKKAKKNSDKRNKPKSSFQETPANPTPMRDDDSKMEDDFYDAEEHTYSVVIKSKKKANKKLSENGERMREENDEDYYK